VQDAAKPSIEDDIQDLRFIASRLLDWNLNNYALQLQKIADRLEARRGHEQVLYPGVMG
jgi:hypothetical protein